MRARRIGDNSAARSRRPRPSARRAGRASADDAKVQVSAEKFPPMHARRKPETGLLIYPGLTLMDRLGPQTVLITSSNVHLVWKNKDLMGWTPASSRTGRRRSPTARKTSTCCSSATAAGQVEVMRDPEVLRFIVDRGARAKYVTSV